MGNKTSSSSSSTKSTKSYVPSFGRMDVSGKHLDMDFSFDQVAKQMQKTIIVSGYSSTFYQAQTKITRGHADNFAYSGQVIHFEHVEYGGRSYADAKAVLEQGSVVGIMLTVQSLNAIYHLPEVLADYEYVYKLNEQSGKHLIPIVIYVDYVTQKDTLYSSYGASKPEQNGMEVLSEALKKYENWQVVYADQSGKALQDALDYFLSFY